MQFKLLYAGAAIAACISMAGTAALAADPVTITIWSNDPPVTDPSAGTQVGASAVLAKEFGEKNPDIKVVYRSVKFDEIVNEAVRAVATGQAPDIINLDNPNHAIFASKGAFLDLTDRLAKSTSIKIQNFVPGPIASVMWNGKYYGLPKGTDTLGLYYNADLFKKAGITEAPKTWDELLAAARKLNNPAGKVYGFSFSAKANGNGAFQYLPFANMGGATFDKINAPGGAAALDFLKTFLDEKLSSPDVLTQNQSESTGTFISGNAAMAVTGNWEINHMASDAKFDWRVALLPTPPGGKPASAMGGWNWGIFASSKHPDAAFKFLEYANSQADRYYPEFSLLSPRTDISVPVTGNANKDAAIKVFLEQMKSAVPRGPHPNWPKVATAIEGAIQAALSGKVPAQTALDQAAATIAAIK